MLLSLLSKEEKLHFIDLLMELISADGEPSETEKKILNRYKKEMGELIAKYKKSSLSQEKLIEYFVNKTYGKVILLQLPPRDGMFYFFRGDKR